MDIACHFGQSAPVPTKSRARRSAKDWRHLLPASIFSVVAEVVCIGFRLDVLAVMFAVAAPLIAFVGGYLLRADQNSSGQQSSVPFLRTSEDDPSSSR